MGNCRRRQRLEAAMRLALTAFIVGGAWLGLAATIWITATVLPTKAEPPGYQRTNCFTVPI